MHPVYTIAQIEAAINFWRQRQAAVDGVTLAANAASLADCYGRMIYRRQVTVVPGALNEAQRCALDIALAERESQKT